MSARGVPRPASTDTMSTWAATEAASPVVSDSGRSAVNQNRGDATASTHAQKARRPSPSSAWKKANSSGTSAAPEIALHTASPLGAGAGTPVARSTGVESLPRAMKTG